MKTFDSLKKVLAAGIIAVLLFSCNNDSEPVHELYYVNYYIQHNQAEDVKMYEPYFAVVNTTASESDFNTVVVTDNKNTQLNMTRRNVNFYESNATPIRIDGDISHTWNLVATYKDGYQLPASVTGRIASSKILGEMVVDRFAYDGKKVVTANIRKVDNANFHGIILIPYYPDEAGTDIPVRVSAELVEKETTGADSQEIKLDLERYFRDKTNVDQVRVAPIARFIAVAGQPFIILEGEYQIITRTSPEFDYTLNEEQE